MTRKNRLFACIIAILTSCLPMLSSSVSVTARLDSVNLLMGNVMPLHLEVVQDEGIQGSFRIFKDMERSRGYIGVCGDSVELRTDFTVDTVELGSGKIQINFTVPVQAFDSGTYRLPRFVFVAGNDSAASNSLTFNVVPVAVTAEDPISGFTGVEEPDGKRFYDWIPDWILDFWWIFLVIALAIIAFMEAMKRYGTTNLKTIISKPQPTAWDVALQDLRNLKQQKLWEQGMEKEYYTRLTDILRVYLFKRFGINAMEMTSMQIMERIRESDFNDKKDYVRQILNVADFVKFAKVRPLPADSIESYDNALKFVEETIPVQQSENKEEAVEDNISNAKKGGDQA